jgi:hypothetical protein
MIANVIDNRTLQYRWERINAVVEPAWHDNKCPDADQATPDEGELDYDERLGISVAEAIKWSESLPYLVALYLSDVV